MEIKKCCSLDDVRSEIDRIDNDIVKLIAERERYVLQAAEFKKDERGVKAPDRVKAVLERVDEKARKYGAPPDIAVTVYKNMIEGFISLEMDKFTSERGKP